MSRRRKQGQRQEQAPQAEPQAETQVPERPAAKAAGKPKSGPPVVETIGMRYVPEQGYVFLRYFTKGDRVVKVEASEPDVRLVASEKFKIAFANMLTAERGDG